ncbi:zinc finger protein 638-like isoform X2 [Salvelinus alpinus]
MSQRLREMCVVFAGPLPSDYTERDVRRLFSSCGNVRAVRLLNATQRVHAEVEFELLEGAALAVEMLNGTLLHSGHIVKVQRPVKESTLDLDVFLSSLQDDPLNANVIYAAGLKANAKTAQFAAKVNGLKAKAAAEVNGSGLNANIAALPAKANHSGLLEKVNGTFLNAKAKLAEANEPGLHAKAKFAKLAELSAEVNGTLLKAKTMLAEIAAEANVVARLHAKTAGLCEEDLREAFGQYGTVQGVILPAKQKRRRHAFLKFDSPDTVDAVLSSPVELWDRKVSTRRALTPPHLCSWVTMTTTGSDRETLDESSQETGREEQEVACVMRKLDRRVGKLFRSLPDNTLSIVLLPGHNRLPLKEDGGNRCSV